MSNHGIAYVAITLVYLAIILGLALWIARRWIGDESDFMIAGREMGAWLTAASLIAINLSGGFVPTIVLMGFLFGLAGGWFFWGWAIGQALVLLTWVGFWRYTGGYTPAEYFEYQYGSSGRIATLGAILLFGLIAGAFQYLGAGKLIAGAIGVPTWVAIVVVGVAITAYAMLAGMWGISITDFIQAIWVIGSVFVLLPIYLFVTYGAPEVSAAMWSLPFGNMPVVALTIPSVLTFVWMQFLLANSAHYWMRSSAGRNQKKVKQGWIIAIVVVAGCGAVGALLGMWANSLLSIGPKKAGLAFGMLLSQKTPIWLGALAVSGVIAATMSTADMMYQMIANTLTRDVFQRYMNIDDHATLLRYSRGAIIGAGAVTISMALLWQSSLPQMIAFALSMGGPLMVLSFDSWVTRYGTKEGAVTMVIAVVIAIFYWNFFAPSSLSGQAHALWISGVVSLGTFYGSSALVRVTGPWWGGETERTPLKPAMGDD